LAAIIPQDHVGDAARVIRAATNCRSQDGRGENADAIGSQILQEPGDRGQDRGAPVFAIEQSRKAVTGLGRLFGPRRRELDLRRILRLAHQKPLRLPLRLVNVATRGQPVSALYDVEATERNEDGWNDRAREHPAPGAEFGKDREDEKADRRSGQRADRLEGECAEHQLPALGTRNVSEMIICAVG
jgi:hypothetical protein